MKLRSKKTGHTIHAYPVIRTCDGEADICYSSINELNEAWEDVKEPLMKDEKIRKAIRAWAEANGIDEVGYIRCREESVFADDNTSIVFYGEITYLDENKDYTIAELCGEEE